MTPCPLPARAQVRDILTDLLGCAVTVTDGPPQRLDEQRPAQLAAYRFDDGQVAALCVNDGVLARSAGGAIAGMAAEELDALDEGRALEGDLEEFHREAVNVLSRLLNSPTTPHVVLGELRAVPGDVPADVAALAREPGARRDYQVAIEGYGTGVMTLVGHADPD